MDPGVRSLGAARWDSRRLTRVIVSRSPKSRTVADAVHDHREALLRAQMGEADEGVIEHMQYRPQDSTPQDLIDVQAVGCTVIGSIARHVLFLKPTSWKGTIPKRVHHKRIVGQLDEQEIRVLGDLYDRVLNGKTRGNDKEALDAIGLGLFHLGRTNRSGGQRT